MDTLYTLEKVDMFIANVCRGAPGLRARAERGEYTAAERSADPRLDKLCRAFERRRQLEEEIRIGMRDTDGHVNVRV